MQIKWVSHYLTGCEIQKIFERSTHFDWWWICCWSKADYDFNHFHWLTATPTHPQLYSLLLPEDHNMDIFISLRWISRSQLQNQWSATSSKNCHLLALLTSFLKESVSLRSSIINTHIFKMVILSLFQMWQKSNKITYLTRESCIFHLEKNWWNSNLYFLRSLRSLRK